MVFQKRKGFTLVELLVVISIIGMLASLLLPAVHVARGTARRTECMNHIRSITQAMDAYHDTKNRYPGYWEHTGSASPATYKDVSWCIVLLPYLDDKNLYDEWRDAPNSSLPKSQQRKVFTCPSDPKRSTTAGNNIIVNGGRRCTSSMGPANTNCYQTEKSANGIFHDRVADHDLRTTKEDIRDGLSNTLLASENVLANDWDQIRGVADVAGQVKAAHVFVWHPVTNPTSDQVINGNIRTATILNADTARPSSFHFQGANFSFADGRTQWLSQTIDYKVLIHLMTPNGKQSDMPPSFQSYSLNEADYIPGS